MVDMTALPTWDEMTDVDKGCALIHAWKCYWEGAGYARSEYPARYLDHPALTALSREDSSDHAASVAGRWEDALDRLGADEVDRLYDLALDEPDRRCLWAARGPMSRVFPMQSEDRARDLIARWGRNGHLQRCADQGHTDPPALLRRDVPGGEWTEVPLVVSTDA